MSLSGRLVPVARFSDLEEAERAGAALTWRSPYPLFGGMALVAVAAWMLPEFACNQCGRRWSKDVRREE